jgi:phospholipase/carboxylesterase
MADRHQDEEILTAEVGDPEKTVVLVHGRGATAGSIQRFGRQVTDDAVLIAPQAHRNTWYPNGFMEPREDNQPWLDDALERVQDCLEIATDRGFERAETALIGFSQGACLATEYAASNPTEYLGVFGLSGGLIGQEVEKDRYSGDMDGTPVFLGCSDRDPHIPQERVDATAAVFDDLDADVDKRIYEGMGHTINDDEQLAIRELLT